MLRAWVAVALALSFTCTVKFAVPAVVGVPVMAPFAARVSPAGNAPVVIDQVLPPAPPLAARVWLYAVPTVALGSDAVVTLNCGGATTMLRAFVAVVLALSFTCTVKLAVPAVVGVPV